MKQSVTVCAILFCVLLFGMAVTFWLTPKKSFSAVCRNYFFLKIEGCVFFLV